MPKILSRLVTATLLTLTVATRLHAETVTVMDLEILDRRADRSDALGAAKHAEACADLRENIAWLGLRRGAYRPPDLNFLERHFRRYARQKSALHNHLETLRKLERYLERLETRRRKALQSLNRALLTAGAERCA